MGLGSHVLLAHCHRKPDPGSEACYAVGRKYLAHPWLLVSEDGLELCFLFFWGYPPVKQHTVDVKSTPFESHFSKPLAFSHLCFFFLINPSLSIPKVDLFEVGEFFLCIQIMAMAFFRHHNDSPVALVMLGVCFCLFKGQSQVRS